MTEPVTLVVSIDTEEDNWQPARKAITVDNVRELPRLQRALDRLGVRPTYFVSYQVALRPWAVEILRDIHAGGTAEIGAHLHPWNTPPLDEEFVPGTMACNLPQWVQAIKITTLTKALTTAIGHRPYSFRAGRWGFGPTTAAALLQCGYRVDSSVTPFHSWAEHDNGPSHVGAPLDVYRLDGNGDIRVPVRGGPLAEVPVSWGYSRGPVSSWARLHALLERPVVRGLRLHGVASRLGLLRHIGLVPEVESVEDMLTLSRHLIAQGVRFLHLAWHSSSLRPGLSPFVRTAGDVERLYATLETYVERLSALAPLRCATVGEAARNLAPPALPGDVDCEAVPVRPRERRLLVISYHHPPDGAIGGMRWAGLTKHLARLGWRSWVLTAAPQPTADADRGVTVVSCPRRRTLNDLYRRLRLRSAAAEAPSGGSTAERWSNGGGMLTQLRLEGAMLLSLPDDARGWVLRAAGQARRLIAQVHPDVVVSTGPPHSAHVVAWVATRRAQVPWLADFRDPWAGPVTAAWHDSPQYRSRLGRFLTTLCERLVVTTATAVVCNTREFVAAIQARYPQADVQWVPNGVDIELLPPRDSCQSPGLSIAYVGTLYGGRDLTPVLRALRLFLDRHPDISRHLCRLRIAGQIEGSQLQRLREDIATLGLEDHVDLLGALSRDAALCLAAGSSLGVVLAQQQELQVPAKLYELVALGVSTVVLAASGSAAHSEALRVGASVVDPGDVAVLARLMDDVSAGRTGHCSPLGSSVDYADLAWGVSQMLAESLRGTHQRISG